VTGGRTMARDRSAISARDAAEEDARLVAGAVAGDRRMFTTLYQRHLDGVFARLTRLVGPAPERDDLAQQIFLDVYRALPRFRGEAAFSTFLHRIVLNVACDHLERQKLRKGRTQPLEPRHLDELVALEASPETRARQRQELAWALRRLDSLSPKRRVAFVLVVVEELSLGEAAALLGGSPDAIKQRVLEARRQLAEERGQREEGRTAGEARIPPEGRGP
jgi:RNA polymerase sigma-70 factor (ECF subfamily)